MSPGRLSDEARGRSLPATRDAEDMVSEPAIRPMRARRSWAASAGDARDTLVRMGVFVLAASQRGLGALATAGMPPRPSTRAADDGIIGSARRGLLANRFHARHEAPPLHELIVSRPAREEIAWIFKVPEYWHVTVYSNRSLEDAQLWPPNLSPQGSWDFQQLPHAAFAEAFAHHLVARYDSLAAYTVFSPAFPLEQSPCLYDMLAHPALLASVQAMSLRVNAELPPAHLQETDRSDVWFRAQRFSLRTLEPVDFVDPHVYSAAERYREKFQVPLDANLMRHFFSQLRVREDWLDEASEVGSFAYGHIVGFTRARARRHPAAVYARLRTMTRLPDPLTLLVERTWLLLLAGSEWMEARPEVDWRRLARAKATRRADEVARDEAQNVQMETR